MDKKMMTALINGIIDEVAVRNGLSEDEARTLVGMCLRRNKECLIQAVCIPGLAVVATVTGGAAPVSVANPVAHDLAVAATAAA